MSPADDCAGHDRRVAPPGTPPAPAIATILVVEGMGCHQCADRVRAALLESADALAVEVDFARGLATVYSRCPLDSRPLAEAVRRAGEASGHRYQVRRFATVSPLAERSMPSRRPRADRA